MKAVTIGRDDSAGYRQYSVLIDGKQHGKLHGHRRDAEALRKELESRMRGGDFDETVESDVYDRLVERKVGPGRPGPYGEYDYEAPKGKARAKHDHATSKEDKLGLDEIKTRAKIRETRLHTPFTTETLDEERQREAREDKAQELSKPPPDPKMAGPTVPPNFPGYPRPDSRMGDEPPDRQPLIDGATVAKDRQPRPSEDEPVAGAHRADKGENIKTHRGSATRTATSKRAKQNQGAARPKSAKGEAADRSNLKPTAGAKPPESATSPANTAEARKDT